MTTAKITYNFTALLTLLSTDNGGRKKPIVNYYRPSFMFGSEEHFSGEIELIGQKEIAPGSSATVKIKLLPSKHISHHLRDGDMFKVLEGNKLVGMGVISKIEIRKSA